MFPRFQASIEVNIYNTRESVSSDFQTPRSQKRVKKKRRVADYFFKMKFEVFGDAMKRCL